MLKAGIGKKINTALIALAIISVFATTIVMLLMTKQAFSNYIDQNNQAMLNQWQPIISDYLVQYGSDDLQTYLNANNAGKGMGMGMGMGMGARQRAASAPMGTRMKQGQRLLVADVNGRVLADTQGLLIGQIAEFDTAHVSSRALYHEGMQLGTLYLISPLGSGLASLENEFISKITTRTAVLAVILGLIALLLGLILGKRISAPLADLSTAIHRLAQGKLEERIKLQGDQEFIELGQDFNLLAQKLEDADKNRRRLTADLSHELRTPLTFLRGQLEGMQNGSIPTDTENTTLLLDEVIRLSRLVKELENLAQVENHAVLLQRTTFSLADLLDRLTPVGMAMQELGIHFGIDAESGITEIDADADRLLQILLNLLSNAMHHVDPKGQVDLSIRSAKGGLQFAVADNGPGIPTEDLPYLFERFYRTDASRSHHAGGMGLGLAIAKGYVEAHHGEIWVESSLGAGTTFYFTLPQA